MLIYYKKLTIFPIFNVLEFRPNVDINQANKNYQYTTWIASKGNTDLRHACITNSR